MHNTAQAVALFALELGSDCGATDGDDDASGPTSDMDLSPWMVDDVK